MDRRHSEDDVKELLDDPGVNGTKLGPTVAKRNEKLVRVLDAIGAGDGVRSCTMHDRTRSLLG